MIEFTVKEVTVCRVTDFLNKALRQIYFLGINEIFTITSSANVVFCTSMYVHGIREHKKKQYL